MYFLEESWWEIMSHDYRIVAANSHFIEKYPKQIKEKCVCMYCVCTV